ncbi:MAG: hypothetical protein KH703_00830 [Campylobacter gracilis]|uniref:hypothetical protein n=1 Tax=Campylobacter gracilis TaxID=824 RepID=UPI0026E9970A|nr:hypothetical protein [Campylobacter gracilis]MBS6151959.1 hypothetical protein [Campylobacter gracilis]
MRKFLLVEFKGLKFKALGISNSKGFEFLKFRRFSVQNFVRSSRVSFKIYTPRLA